MSETRDDGGAAFPRVVGSTRYEARDADKAYEFESADGMSLRDYFAAKAMAAFIVSERDPLAMAYDYSYFAAHAYRVADAMIAERAK